MSEGPNFADALTGLQGSLHGHYPLLGLVRAHHRNKRGGPIEFGRMPYLIPLYAMGPAMRGADFSKAPQTGITEFLIALELYSAGWLDRIAAYCLPQHPTAHRFVDERINPLLASVPAYAERTPGEAWGATDAVSKGNLRRKRFGARGSLLFLGSNTEADFVEFSCDVAVVDEYDLCDHTNTVKIINRTRESQHPQTFRVGNPELAGAGIERLWTDGSQGRWYHRCGACGERQPLDWEQFVERADDGHWILRDRERWSTGDPRPICRRCAKPFERGHGGMWIAQYRDRWTSLHTSRLDILADRTSDQIEHREPIRQYFAEWVAAQGDLRRVTAFYVGVLGKSYESAGERVTMDMLHRCATGPELDHHGDPRMYDRRVVVAGVDVGSVLHVTVSAIEDAGGVYRRRAIWFGTVREGEDIDDVITRYSVDVLVIDALPETRMSKQLRDRWRDRREECDIWLSMFSSSPKIGTDDIDLRLDYEERVVSTDRTQLLDATHAEYARGIRVLPRDFDVVLGFSDQMKASVRKLDDRGRRYVWDEGTRPDHFRLADAYERVALELHDRGGAMHEV